MYYTEKSLKAGAVIFIMLMLFKTFTPYHPLFDPQYNLAVKFFGSLLLYIECSALALIFLTIKRCASRPIFKGKIRKSRS